MPRNKTHTRQYATASVQLWPEAHIPGPTWWSPPTHHDATCYNVSFILEIQLRLGHGQVVEDGQRCTHMKEDGQVCGKLVDPQGIHALRCKRRGGRWVGRHDHTGSTVNANMTQWEVKWERVRTMKGLLSREEGHRVAPDTMFKWPGG